MHRVLKPGGLALMSFSNRCFPTKGHTFMADRLCSCSVTALSDSDLDENGRCGSHLHRGILLPLLRRRRIRSSPMRRYLTEGGVLWNQRSVVCRLCSQSVRYRNSFYLHECLLLIDMQKSATLCPTMGQSQLRHPICARLSPWSVGFSHIRFTSSPPRDHRSSRSET